MQADMFDQVAAYALAPMFWLNKERIQFPISI